MELDGVSNPHLELKDPDVRQGLRAPSLATRRRGRCKERRSCFHLFQRVFERRSLALHLVGTGGDRARVEPMTGAREAVVSRRRKAAVSLLVEG